LVGGNGCGRIPSGRPGRRRETLLFPLAGVALVTALLLGVVGYSDFKFEPIIFLIPVVICALRWGHLSAIVGALASTASSDFFFIPQVYSLEINDPNQIVELGLFLFVAVVTASLGVRLKNEADALRRREHQLANLYEFSRRLAACSTTQDLVGAIQEYLSLHLGCEAHLIRLAADFEERREPAGVCLPAEIARQARAMIAARETASRLAIETDRLSIRLPVSSVTPPSAAALSDAQAG